MTSSKIFLTIVATALAAGLTACQKKDTRLESDNGATFYVDSVSGTFTNADIQQNDIVNRKFANFTACVKDNAMQSAVMGLKFQISAGTVSFTKTTDDRGCLVWQEYITYDPSDDARQIPLDRAVTAVEGHSGTENIRITYDPWDGDKLTFAKREASLTPEPERVTYQAGGKVERGRLETTMTIDGNAKNSRVVVNYVDVDMRTAVQNTHGPKQLYVSSLFLQFAKRDFDNYRINSALDLQIAHVYRAKFNVGVIRHNISEGTIAQNLNAGKFKVYFALLKDGYDQHLSDADPQIASYVVAASEFEGDVVLGRFIADLSLRFNNVAALASRMTGILTIQSLDNPDSFAETSYEGNLLPMNGGPAPQNLDLLPSNLNARNLYEIEQKIEADRQNVNGLELFRTQSGYAELMNTTVPGTGMFSSGGTNLFDLLRITKSKQTLGYMEKKEYGQALCQAFFSGSNVPAWGKALSACLKDPTRYILGTTRDFVVGVNNPVPRKVGPPMVETLSVNAGMDFSQAKSHSHGHTDTRSFSLSGSLGAEAGGKVGWTGLNSAGKALPMGPSASLSGSIGAKASIGREWFNTSSFTTSENQSSTVSAKTNVTVTAEGFRFEMDVNVQTCFLFAPSPELWSLMADAKGPFQGKFFCDGKVQAQTRQEAYYFLNQATGDVGSPMSDNMSSEDNPWRMFIRGVNTYNMFSTLFAKKGVTLNFDKMAEDQISKQFNEFYVTQEFPGMLTP